MTCSRVHGTDRKISTGLHLYSQEVLARRYETIHSYTLRFVQLFDMIKRLSTGNTRSLHTQVLYAVRSASVHVYHFNTDSLSCITPISPFQDCLGCTICGDATAAKYPHGVGGVSAVDINCTNAGQVAVMKANRLGIPVSYYAETTHSGGAPGTTVFPMPCSQVHSIPSLFYHHTLRL